jgi:hypothetical protein
LDFHSPWRQHGSTERHSRRRQIDPQALRPPARAGDAQSEGFRKQLFSAIGGGIPAAHAQAWGSDENAYVRQVVSYWDMAASLVLRGALHEELFLDSAGEMVFTFAKLHPFLAEIRERMGIAEFLRNIETLLNRSESGRAKAQSDPGACASRLRDAQKDGQGLKGLKG